MPNVREPLDPRESMWHFLAFFMRFWREKKGLSLAQCGQLMGSARSSVSNLEAGRRRPQDDQMRALDLHYGTGVLFQLLLWYARAAHDPNWFRQYAQYEQQATSIKMFHGGGIPLLLQTDEYTRANVQIGSHRDREHEYSQRVDRKRSILDRADPPDIWVLLDEAVLARPVGDDPEIMMSQLEHLLAMAALPHVIVRIVPFSSGPHLGSEGFFQLIRMADRDVAYAGAPGGGRLIESPGETRAMDDRFDRIGAKAASEDVSRDIVKQYLERYL